MVKTKAASLQFNHAPGGKKASVGTIRSCVGKAVEEGVALIGFP